MVNQNPETWRVVDTDSEDFFDLDALFTFEKSTDEEEITWDSSPSPEPDSAENEIMDDIQFEIQDDTPEWVEFDN